MSEGTVKWFNSQKGYGFIQRATGQRMFSCTSPVERAGLRGLNEGQKISLDAERGPANESSRAARGRSMMCS